jgi:Tfp pilus assembly PilM family ATPase
VARRILALDLGSHMLKAVLIERNLKDCQVLSYLRVQRDPTRPLVEQIKELCGPHSQNGATVLSCLPGEVIFHRLLLLPFARTRQLNQTVPFELESQIPLALEEVVVDFQVVGRTAAGVTVLAVAIPKRILAEHLDLLAAAGLDPAVVGLTSLAPLTLLNLSGVEKEGATALLDIGEQRTSVLLLHDGVVSGLRTLSVGLSREGGFEAFVRELRWTLLALNGRDPVLPTRFFLAGGGAYFPRLQDEFARTLAVEVRPVQQLVLPHIPRVNRKQQAEFAVCLGLGLREALGLAVPAVNLRRGEFAQQGQRAVTQREFSRLGWIAAGAVAAAALAVTLELYRLQTRYQAVRQEVRRVFTSTLPEVHTIVNEKAQLQEAVNTLQQQQRRLGGTVTTSPLEILRQLSIALPERVTLDLDEWTLDGNAVRLRGTTDSFDTAETIKTTTAALGLFREVQLKDVKTVAGGKKVSFGLHLFFAQENQ